MWTFKELTELCFGCATKLLMHLRDFHLAELPNRPIDLCCPLPNIGMQTDTGYNIVYIKYI